MPERTTEQVETEIEELRKQTTLTERWMSARARRRMEEFESKDRGLRDAFEAGYRMGQDNSFIAPLTALAIGLAVAQILSLANGYGWLWQ